MIAYQSEFNHKRRVWLARLRAMAAGGVLVGAFLLVSRWDFQDATAAQAVPAFVQETGCRAPREGEVLYARVEREPEGPGMGYLCTYYSNAGFGRKARAERRDYVRMGRAG
jgi:hypothetical protein